MGSSRYDEIVDLLGERNAGDGAATPAAAAPAAAPAETSGSEAILAEESIVLGGVATSRDDAISEAGRLLVASGAVDESYVTAMHEREQSVSTYMGNGLAIPHGTNDAKNDIKKSAVSFVRYDNPIDWNGNEATFVVGIAGSDGSHLKLLSKLAKAFGNKETVAKLSAAQSEGEIIELLGKVNG